MTTEPLAPASAEDLADALAFALRYSGRKRVHDSAEIMATIVARRLVWESLHGRAAFFTDGRMSAEVVRVLAVDAPAADAYYATTLFDAGQAYAGTPCGAASP